MRGLISSALATQNGELASRFCANRPDQTRDGSSHFQVYNRGLCALPRDRSKLDRNELIITIHRENRT